MKKHVKELVFLGLHLLLFYVYPAYAIPIDPMGAVLIMVFLVFVMGLVLGILSRSSLKWVCPAVYAVLFLPTVPIYYNSSALVHALWYLVMALSGLVIGSGIAALVRKLRKKA